MRLMSRPWQHLLIAALGLLVAGSVVSAQPVRTQTGQELDANPLVGSGGINAPLGEPSRLNSQLFVVGQVTGLGAFQGSVPYTAANQLNVTVPSAALDTFRQQSVGLMDVQRGQTYAPAPFYGSRTAFTLGGITGGYTAPGTNMPMSSMVDESLARQLMVNATAGYGPIINQLPGQLLAVPPVPQVVSPGQFGRPGPEPAKEQPVTASARVGASATFGLPRSEDREELERELRAMTRGGLIDQRIKTRIETLRTQDANAPGTKGEVPGEQAEESRTLGGEQLGLPSGQLGARPMERQGGLMNPPGTPSARAGLPEANQDVFLDILVGLTQQRRGKAAAEQPVQNGPGYPRVVSESAESLNPPTPPAAPKELTPATPSGFGPPSVGNPPSGVNPLPGLGPAGQTAPAAPAGGTGGLAIVPGVVAGTSGPRVPTRNLVEMTADRGVVIHGLAGRSRDMFNAHMTKAEQLLRAGKYYPAAEEYQYAMIIKPGNPLPDIGTALAVFAAGEPRTAGLNLHKALEVFPPIMETRFSVPEIIGQAAFNRQLQQVDAFLGQGAETDPMIALTATFMHYNAGQIVEARGCARQLQSAPQSDKIYAAYATYVLTGKRPGEQAAPAEPGK